jgi:hypothetical protein
MLDKILRYLIPHLGCFVNDIKEGNGKIYLTNG